MSKKLIGCAAALAFSVALAMPLAASAATLTQPQISAIVSLLQSFGADSATVARVQMTLSGTPTTPITPPTSSASCVNLSYNLDLGVTDSTTQGQVTALQQFLRISPTTGRFGSTTLQAVGKWQVDNGVVSSGTATTTGYGRVGPKTRAAMACGTTSTTYNRPNQYNQPNNVNNLLQQIQTNTTNNLPQPLVLKLAQIKANLPMWVSAHPDQQSNIITALQTLNGRLMANDATGVNAIADQILTSISR